ncbi:MAG: WhiB family transcriptional regulator [Actinomycetota bacterium]
MTAQDVHLEPMWQHRAACRGPNQAIFFPPAQLERRSDKRMRERRAKEICGTCPVQMECREYSIQIREQHGIWGGLTEVERRSVGGW